MKIKITRSWNTFNFSLNKETHQECETLISKIEEVERCDRLKYVYVVMIGECFNKRKTKKKVKEILKDFHIK